MLTTLNKPTLVSQAVTLLKREIEAGQWPEWLPSERALSSGLRISRPTLRLALSALQRSGLVTPVHGVGYRVRPYSRGSAAKGEPAGVDVLCPDEFVRIRHQSLLWLDELRGLLSHGHCDIRLHFGERFLCRGVNASLNRLVRQQRSDCWLLCHSSRAIQQWFANRRANGERLPALVIGYSFSECQLPSVTIDYEAACRHAIGTLVRKGHRKILYFRWRSPRLGDALSESAALEAARLCRNPDVQVKVATYDRDAVDAIANALRRELRAHLRCTAILVDTPSAYLALATILPSWNIKVPKDLSLVSREYDCFFEHLFPRPACYVFTPQKLATEAYNMIERIRSGEPLGEGTRIIPTFSPGDSVGPVS